MLVNDLNTLHEKKTIQTLGYHKIKNNVTLIMVEMKMYKKIIYTVHIICKLHIFIVVITVVQEE